MAIRSLMAWLNTCVSTSPQVAFNAATKTAPNIKILTMIVSFGCAKTETTPQHGEKSPWQGLLLVFEEASYSLISAVVYEETSVTKHNAEELESA